jgi:ABC-type lipoprotein export system ATPase subunit
MVTHDQDLARQVDRTLVIADGRIVNQVVHSLRLPATTATSQREPAQEDAVHG